MQIESAAPTHARFLISAAFFRDETYHFFADNRSVWGIPNFWNVTSNLAFAIGVLLTFFGSAYYRLAPSNRRLVWDRLPMTLVFMAPLARVVTGESHLPFSRLLLASLVTCGAASVLWWRLTNGRYALAKLGEFYDRAIFSNLPMSGHTAKHILAAAATYFIFRWRLAAAR